MSGRRLPVRPNLDQLKHQAKDLLRAIHQGDPSAVEEFRQYHRYLEAKGCRTRSLAGWEAAMMHGSQRQFKERATCV